MPYQVLARKWRPQNFTEMVGQEHVLRALINALDQNRLHHAYLFTGTRGVGKTSIARILAKCLNCEKGISSTPCGNCGICQAITEGRFVDLIEVDAASRTKVEDTRELLENVQYSPNRGRYKVYLIDEVHMLSGHSFNALLKTLEEPPPHVIFLLATTDPQRLPVTILSRCLQFHLKNMSPEMIVGHLENLLKQENIPYEIAALWQLGRAADGSMRDALSLLDQAIAYGNGKVLENDVHTLLGTLPIQQITPLLDALINNDAQQIIKHTQNLAEQGADFHQILEELLSLLQQIALAQVAPESIDQNQIAHSKILELAKQIIAEDVQLYYQIGLIGRRDLSLAPNAKMGFEMIMLRILIFRPDTATQNTGTLNNKHETKQHSAKLNNKQEAKQNTENHNNQLESKQISGNLNHQHDTKQDSEIFNKQREVQQNTKNSNNQHETKQNSINQQNTASFTQHITAQQNIPSTQSENTWTELVKNLSLTGITLALAQNCAMEKMDDAVINLLLDPSHAALLNPRHQDRLKEALETYLNKSIKLHIKIGTPNAETPAQYQQRAKSAEHQAAQKTLEEDPGIQQLLKTFNATIQPDSIKTVDNDITDNT